MRAKRFEEYVYVLDVFPYGKPGRPFKGPVAQVVGENYFVLLEVCLKKGVTVSIGERLYVGRTGRDKVNFVMGKIRYEDLTGVAKRELERIVEELVRKRESDFVAFFNNASPVAPRLHALQLLPGVGKKFLKKLLAERAKKPFESFEDIKTRTGLPNPAKIVARRILEEIIGPPDNYRLFVTC